MEDPQAQTPFQPVSSGSAYPPPNGSYPPGAAYPPPHSAAPPPYTPPVGLPAGGISDNAAGALAYITILPAILFLLIAPYNQRPFVRFHAFQCLGLALAGVILNLFHIIPVLGTLVAILGSLVLFAVWVVAIVKAAGGSYLKLPFISDFAAQQSGFPLR